MSKWWTTLPSESRYAVTVARGVVDSSKPRQRCSASVRGCMRTSMMLSLIGFSYVKRVRWRTVYCMQSGERRVEVIADEGSMGRSMDLPALPADAVQERLEAVVDDFVQLGVVQRGAQAAGEAL